MPVERKLPEALEELFNQMQHRLRINLSEMLDECLKNSMKTYQLMQDTEKAESERVALIQSLPVRHSDIGSKDITRKVAYLMNLQRAKVECPENKVKEQEIHATSMWCELLILSLSTDTVTNGLMKRAVEDDILSGIEAAGLLNERGTIGRDYEQYCEEHLGCSLDEATDISIKDFLGLCEKRFQEILGIKEGAEKGRNEENNG